MNLELPQKVDRERLYQLPKEELVKMLIEQAISIEKLQANIKELKQEIERLQVSKDLDSKTSSKPPSSDLLKKSENKSAAQQIDTIKDKRKPGGQPGHQGKTRKGFGRVDRFEILRPELCTCCGRAAFVNKALNIETQVVAQLVERPIEIVEDQRFSLGL